MIEATITAFADEQLIAAGSRVDVALAIKRALDADSARTILAFDDETGRVVDFDLRGTEDEVRARLSPAAAPTVRAPGRPRLGVVAREVTLLPRHWDWLAAQPGGTSVALRKLVESARADDDGAGRVHQAQQAADRFMAATLGNRPGYEDASRALYARDEARFAALIAPWPDALGRHAARLAAPAFAGKPGS